MNKTLVVGGNVTGNIGSCEIKSTDVTIDTFHTQTVAVNSCNGDIVAQNTYFSYWSVLMFGLLLLFIFFIGLMCLSVIDY